MNDGILFDSEGETAAQAVIAALTRRGFHVVRSFDLRSALAMHTHDDASAWDCGCPYHGTAQCTCQFVVLLVYGDAGAPVVVNAHSRDAQTHVRLVQSASRIFDGATTPDPRLAEQVMAALVEATRTLKTTPVHFADAAAADAM